VKLLAVLAGYLGPWVWAAVLGVLLATHCAVAWWVRAEVTEYHELREAKAKAATEAALRKEQAKQRQIEERYQSAVNQATEALTDARKTIAQQARDISSLRLDAGGLRNQLAAYAAGRTGPDPAATPEDRSRVLAAVAAEGAELLAEGGQLLAACARDHDERAAEVAALLSAWPR
jgi:hypothetical protein